MTYEAVTSASAIERVTECAASAVLPKVRRASGPDAERGTEIHGYIRAILAGVKQETALEAVPPQWRETCAKIDFQRLLAGVDVAQSEVAYAIDVQSMKARCLGANIGREYSRFDITATEIPGSCDIDALHYNTGARVVIDVKTGHSRVAPCRENTQIMFFALAMMLLTGANQIEGRIAYISESGEVWNDAHVFTRLELELFADELETTVLKRVPEARRVYLENGTAKVKQGDHCRYCDSMTYCPAYTSLARTMATDMEQIAAKVEELTDEQAGVAWTKVKAVLTLAESVEKSLKERARQSPFPTPDGKIVTALPKRGRECFSASSAIEMLRARGATDADISSLYRVSGPSVEIRAVKPKRQLARRSAA